MAVVREQSRTVRIGAPPRKVREALEDFESYPDWMSNVSETEVLERDKRKRARQVRYRINAVVREVEYVLAYSYTRDGMDISYVRGDLRDVSASYRWESDGEGGTLLTYTYGADLGLPLTRFLAGRLNRAVMDAALRDVKHRAESLG